ncbi:hypothetical protein [Ramlibacter sp. AN1133]|uniref:hypothetical protein n=1 Tax=Ramlibacter sp. AN1133 TaxID=3133429 RepID=UPI0030BEE342
MDPSRLELARTELDFLQRLLLDVQRRLGRDALADADDAQLVAALELALALLRWNGETPPELDAQVGLGAAVQMKLGGDGMCAYRQWRTERRRLVAPVEATPGTTPR